MMSIGVWGCILFFMAGFNALGAEHDHLNWDLVMKKAAQEDKMVMLLVEQNGCPWCEKLKRETLSQPLVKRAVEEHFVPLILNSDTDEVPPCYRGTPKPVLFFIDPEEGEVWRSVGYKKSSALLEAFDNALKSWALDRKEALE